LVCSAIAALLWLATRRRLAGAAFLAYASLLPLGFVMTIANVNPSNPHVRQYNERLERLSLEAQLIGDTEDRVIKALGSPTDVSTYWTSTDAATGEPAPGARLVTTYNYAPYWFFPFCVFQVHCRDGIVQSIELYDY
jgi:hypothetical protein